MTVDAAAMASSIRRIVIEQAKRSGSGHIGSCLSIADMLAVLYGGVMEVSGPSDHDRDRFILSKGHAALALFAALHLRGWVTAEDLESFGDDASKLGMHPEHGLAGVDFSTGSLGHGLPIGAGAALAARLEHSSRRVFVLISDAECNEGSTWEAVMFAAHHCLSNLVVLVDLNGQQALGQTCDILNMSPMADRWRAFGWEATDVDGHDVSALTAALATFDKEVGPPHVLIAHTIFGKGISFMERQLAWHYISMSDDDYRLAVNELEESICGPRSYVP